MLKRYLIPGLLLAGCAVAFIIFSLLVFISKGKSPRLLKKKLLLGVLVISLSGALASCQLDISAVTQLVAPRKIKIPTCYIAPNPDELVIVRSKENPTTLCYVVVQPEIVSNTMSKPIKTPTCYIVLPPEIKTAATTGPIKHTCYRAQLEQTALMPDHLCYAPVRLS